VAAGSLTVADLASLDLYVSPEHACNYLPQRQARSVFVDPGFTMDQALYGLLAAHGFRRSGPHVYRPHCEGCQACVPIRVPVAGFRPDRTQKRLYRRNADLRCSLRPAEFDPEHFALYGRYVAARHPDGGMDGGSEADYRQFLLSPWGKTSLLEIRADGQLLAVAVTDELPDALSAVYTFYDPASGDRSLGTYAILMQIEETRRRGMGWLYLGYWIAESRKMSYKGRFRPFETLDADGWRPQATPS
jgi:arginyl-tRNA--protein-N-Asp/Glu arginylyltransferase